MAQESQPLTPTAIALRITSGLDKDSHDFVTAGRYVALSHWRTGDFGAAFALLEASPAETQLELLTYLASEAVARSQTKLAQSILTRGLDVIARHEDVRGSVWIPAFIERALEIDDLEAAERFADFIDEGTPQRAKQLITIAKAWAKKKNKEQAIAFIDRALKQIDSFEVEEGREVIGLVTSAATVLLHAGEIERATALAGKVNDLLASETEPHHSDELDVISLFAQVGEISRARSMIESSERIDKVDGLISIAYVYHEKGEESAALSLLVRAREIAQSTSEGDYSLAMALNPIIDAYLKLHRRDEAFEVFQSINHDYYLSNSGNRIADSYKVDRPKDALAVLDFAFSRVRLTVSEKSEDIPGSASRSKAKEKSHALISLVTKYIELSSPSAAEAAAKEIDHPQYKAFALSKVALAYSKANDNLKARALLAKAYELATESEEYNHDQSLEETLLAIANGYATAGFKQAAAKVVLRLLYELRDVDRCCSGPVGILMEIARMVESEKISLDKESQRVLRQLADQFVKP